MEYQLIRSRRRTLSVHIDEAGKIVVKAPMQTSRERIEQFLQEKQQWITSTQTRVRGDLLFFREILEGSEVLWLGQRYRVLSCAKRRARLTEDGLEVWAQNPRGSAAGWLKKQAELYLPARCAELSAALKLDYESVKVKSYRSKWGSCSSRGEISFNYRLIMLDKRCIDYVIVHELCHLVELNHSKAFWSLVQQIMPDYKLWKDSTRKHNILAHST